MTIHRAIDDIKTGSSELSAKRSRSDHFRIAEPYEHLGKVEVRHPHV